MPGCSFSDGLLRIGPRTGCGSPTRSSGRWCRRPPREGPAPQASATRQRRSLSLVNIDDLPTRRISRSRSTSIHPMKAVPRARWAQRSAPIIPQRAQTPAASLINLSRRTVQPPCSAGAGEHLGATRRRPVPPWRSGRRAARSGGRSWLPRLSDDPVDEDRPRSRATDHAWYARPLPPPGERQWRRRPRQNARLDNICMT